MPLLNFSKTRVVYWDSGKSSITLPANADTLPTGVSFLTDNVALPYRLAKLVGQDATTTTVGHQWHVIPYNAYGYYCTPAEINAVIENSNSFTPISCNYSIGHTIPLSRTATASTTQLSFNNTIYSLITDLPANDHVTCEEPFDLASLNTFCRTFDGAKYSDQTRNLLLIPDLYFKVPRVKSPGTNNPTPGPDTSAFYPDFLEQGTTLPDGYTQNAA